MKAPIKFLGSIFLTIILFVFIITTIANNSNRNYEQNKNEPIIDELFLECNQNIRFEIINACYNIRASELIVTILNKGTTPIHGANFITNDNYVLERQDIIARNSQSSYVLSINTKPQYLEMIPKVLFNNVATECRSLIYKIEEITTC